MRNLLTYGAVLLTCCVVIFRGWEYAMWAFALVGTIIPACYALYSILPRVFMNWLYLLLSYVIPLFSTSATAASLSWLDFGAKIVHVLDNKEDPTICAIVCKIIILTTQGETSGAVLDLYVNADVLGKILVALETQLRNLRAKQLRRVECALEYAAQLRPISQVLVMLVKAYDRMDSRPTTKRVACAVLKEYRSISSSSSIASIDQQEDIAAIIYNTATVLQVLIIHSEELLDDLVNDKEGFCLSMKGLIAQQQRDGSSLRTAGQVCTLIHCLLQTRLLYAEPDSAVVDRLFSSAGELHAHLIRLLEREASVGLSDSNRGREDLTVEAIARTCTVVGILSLLRLYSPVVLESTESIQQTDASLSNALSSLGRRVVEQRPEQGSDYNSVIEVKRLLRLQVLTDQVAALLNSHYSHLSSTRVALRTLLMTAISPLGLGRGNVKVEALRDIVSSSEPAADLLQRLQGVMTAEVSTFNTCAGITLQGQNVYESSNSPDRSPSATEVGATTQFPATTTTSSHHNSPAESPTSYMTGLASTSTEFAAVDSDSDDGEGDGTSDDITDHHDTNITRVLLDSTSGQITTNTNTNTNTTGATNANRDRKRVQYWVREHESALVAAFVESNASPICDEKAIAKMMQSGKIDNSPRMHSRIQEKWTKLPQRIRAVLRNSTDDENVRKNDKHGFLREYIKKHPNFFQRWR